MKILLLLLATTSGFAQSVSLAERARSVYHDCFSASRWSSVPAIQGRPQNYRQFYRPVPGTTSLENKLLTFGYVDLLWEGWKDTEALQLFTSIIDRGKEIAAIEQLSDLQKICLAQCVSSRIIIADTKAKVSFKNLGQLFESVPSTIEKGSATCRGFARVFYSVANKLGLDSKLVASTNHIFNEVHTSEGKIHLDPREQNCYLWR